MPKEEQLNIDERFKVIRMTQRRYRDASRDDKQLILDELEPLLGLHRKSIIRLLAGDGLRHPSQAKRSRGYSVKLDDALRVISEAHNHICAELLQPNLVSMAEVLAQHHELELTEELRQELATVSVSTVGRYLARLRQDEPRHRRRPSASTAHARSMIPMGRIAWDEPAPGHMEVDLVFHCGAESKGEFVYTLDMVDVKTGWVELAALLGRSDRVMVDAFTRCEQRMPFPILEVHTDNGSEFFTAAVLRHWREHAQVPDLSRGHPYRKNDNRFVEHRNGALVRVWIGHDRLDTAQQTIALNRIYTLLCRYHNFCQPVIRLKEKNKLENGKIKRLHDTAQTPYERLKATGVLTADQITALDEIRSQINPRALCKQIKEEIDALLQLPPAQAGRTEDIFQTLLPS